MRGFEPLTSSVQERRSPAELHPHVRRFGIRRFVFCSDFYEFRIHEFTDTVGLPGLEPGTFPLSEECSSRLS